MTDERDPKVQLLVEKRVSEAREEAAQNVSEARENMASRILDAREDATKKAHRARNEAIGVLAFVALVLTIGGWFGLQYVAKGQLDDRALQSLLSEATTARDRILGYESQAREDLGTIERLQSLQESVKSRLANLKLAKTYELEDDRVKGCGSNFTRECLAMADNPCIDKGFVGGFVAGMSTKNGKFHAVCVK